MNAFFWQCFGSTVAGLYLVFALTVKGLDQVEDWRNRSQR